MCKYCMTHGAGKKWYLEARNYTRGLLEEKHGIEYLDEYFKKYEGASGNELRGLLKLKKVPGVNNIVTVLGNRWFEKNLHLQPVLFEEALQVVKMVEKIGIVDCACRKVSGREDLRTCMALGPALDTGGRYPKYTGGIDYLSREEAEEKLEGFQEAGFYHSVATAGTPFIAFLCSCDARYCQHLKWRRDGFKEAMYKGEFVCQVNGNCTGCLRCLPRCKFGAIRLEGDAILIDSRKCYGCGVCRGACEESAIEVLPRRSPW